MDLRAKAPYLYIHPVDSASAPQLINDTYTEGPTAVAPKNTQQSLVVMQAAYEHMITVLDQN